MAGSFFKKKGDNHSRFRRLYELGRERVENESVKKLTSSEFNPGPMVTQRANHSNNNDLETSRFRGAVVSVLTTHHRGSCSIPELMCGEERIDMKMSHNTPRGFTSLESLWFSRPSLHRSFEQLIEIFKNYFKSIGRKWYIFDAL